MSPAKITLPFGFGRLPRAVVGIVNRAHLSVCYTAFEMGNVNKTHGRKHVCRRTTSVVLGSFSSPAAFFFNP